MAHNVSEKRKEVQVEELLRLKRMERPDDAFWGEFDRELHQRMLRTLVKKDPWYAQVMRGLSGRVAQTVAVASAAVVVAAVVVRPALIGPGPEDAPAVVASQAATAAPGDVAAPVQLTGADVSYSDLSRSAQSRDYKIDAISAPADAPDAGFKRDFGMDRVQVASYDNVAYSTDSPSARSVFTGGGVASLVY